MTKNITREEEIKLEELKFIKQQEQFIDQKINIIVVIVGIFVSGSFILFSVKFNSMLIDKKIFFFLNTGIAICLPFVAVFPKIFISKKRNKKGILNNLSSKDNLYKKEYQQWNIDLATSLDTQINLSRHLLKSKVFFCRTLIIIEFFTFLGIVLIFAFSF